MKICNKCLLEKDEIDYYKNNRNKDKLENRCKECIKEINKQNREKLLESQRRWREKNPDYMKNYEKNDKCKEYHRKYYEENKDKYSMRTKEWRKNNPERYKNARINYIENNRGKTNK